MMRFLLQLALLFVLLCLPWAASAQQEIIWSETFERAGDDFPPFWSLDDASAGQRNRWRLTSAYTQTGFSTTPDQPAEITGSPRSRYLHIGTTTQPAIAVADYDRTRASRCTLLTPVINALQHTEVSLRFAYISGGQADRDFGQVLVRELDGPWLELTPVLAGVSEWTFLTVDAPLGGLDNKLVQFAFVWQNDADGQGAAPSFAVDQISVSGNRLAQGVIALVDGSEQFCAGGNGQVMWLAYGEFGVGNQFRVQLSDAAGQFSEDSPVIGTASSRNSEGVIPVRLPEDLSAGGDYRVRILSTDPALVSANTAALNFQPPAEAGEAITSDEVVCPGNSAILQLQGYLGEIRWQQSGNGRDFQEIPGSDLDFFVSDPLTAETWFRARVFNPGCPSVFSAPVHVRIAEMPVSGVVSAAPDRRCAPGPVDVLLSGHSPSARNQWEISDDGFAYFEIMDANADRYTVNNLSSEQFVRCALTNELCPAQPVYTEPLRLAYGLDVIVTLNPSVPQPGEPVEFMLAVDGSDVPLTIAFMPGDGGEPRFFESIEGNRYSFFHTYAEEGIFNYEIMVVEDDDENRCEGRVSGAVRVSEQVIELASILPPFICLPFDGEISFNAIGAYDDGNRFEVQLSDASGDFSNPTVLGSGSTSPVSFLIPAGLPAGDFYAVRIASTAPHIFSPSITGIELAPGVAGGKVTATPGHVCQPDMIELSLADHDQFSIIEWEFSTDGVEFEALPDSDSPTYEFGPIDQTAWFRANLTPFGAGGCGVAYSDTARVRFGLDVSVQIEPANPTAGEPVSFRLQVEGAAPPFSLDVDYGDGNGLETLVEALPFSFEHAYSVDGDYDLDVTVTNTALGCEGRFQGTIYVMPEEFTALSILEVQPQGFGWCPGTLLTVEALAEGNFTRGNEFILELSDAAGSFDAPNFIGSLSSRSGSVFLNGQVPYDLPEGEGYLLRVRSTAPPTSALDLTPYALYPSPAKPIIRQAQDTLIAEAAGADAWRWYFEETQVNGETDSVYVQPEREGLYFAEIVDSNGCTRLSDGFLYQSVSRNPADATDLLRVYPNPAQERLNVAYSLTGTDQVRLSVLSLDGRRIYERSGLPASGAVALDLTDYAPSLYLLQLETATGQLQTVKFVVAE